MKQKDIDYINEKGLDTIREHAREFIAKKRAPAVIPNDGKQTPMKGHPVFCGTARKRQHVVGSALESGTKYNREES